MTSLSKRMLATVCYADIFDYPLTPNDLRFWLIGKPARSLGEVGGMTIRRGRTGTYCILKRRESIIRTRKLREKIAEEKWKLAFSFARFFSFIPTVQLVGVTGGLSMNNADRNDDIDLFFITAKGTLWVTRAIATALSDALGIRRKPGDRVFSDKICLNMFMAEDALSLPKNERDLFSAHEVLQLKVLWSRGGTYGRFLQSNAWVKTLLPTAWQETMERKDTVPTRRNSVFSGPVRLLFSLIEPFSRSYQLRYMEPRRTTEVITQGLLRFHPSDARIWIKKKLEKRLKRFNIPLDNIFYRP